MSQRLSKTTAPIGITSKGVAVFAIRGADPGDPDDQNGEGGESGSGENGGSGGGTGSEGQNTGNNEGSGENEGSTPKTYSAEEFAALEARMKAADANASKAQNALKAIEDAKKDDLTKATEKVTELESSLKEKDNTIAELRFANEFALNNSVVWHDPSLVLAQVRNRPEVTVNEDGTIKGLDAALKALAKEKPFLVKQDGETSGPPRSGSSTGSGASGKPPKKDEAALRRKYAALNI